MKNFFNWAFYYAFARHCHALHGADYVVCRRPLCQLAYWLERVTRFQERRNAGEW